MDLIKETNTFHEIYEILKRDWLYNKQYNFIQSPNNKIRMKLDIMFCYNYDKNAPNSGEEIIVENIGVSTTANYKLYDNFIIINDTIAIKYKD